MKKRRKRGGKLWSVAEGDRGHTVTVFERERDGPLYARAFDPSLRNGRGDYRRVSLGHRDKERAKVYALAQAAKLREGQADIIAGRVTLARLLAVHRTYRPPLKRKTDRVEEERRAQMWTRFLGGGKDPNRITLSEWNRFIDARLSGAIDGRGCPVPDKDRTAVGARTVQSDCQWLRSVLRWGTKWQDRDGNYLLREDATRGFGMPHEKNPNRPVATHDRYEAIRAVSDQVMMEIRWDGHRRNQRSYLSELLDIANGTGRRISAVCALRYEDLQLDAKQYGKVRWPADTEKTGRETIVPISQTVRAALDRVLKERPGIGGAYLFPAPIDRERPMRYELASAWLRRAEVLAKLPKQHG